MPSRALLHARRSSGRPPRQVWRWSHRRGGFASSHERDQAGRLRDGHHGAMPTFDDAIRSLDARFARLRDEARIPGVAWGIVSHGSLVHAGGAGTTRHGEDRRPDARSVFRIASMTKSFTASTVLLLRDEGHLRLDDPVAAYVPELVGWRLPTADSVPVTVRQLLTMSAGLATDDPWGDRQQGPPARPA